MDERLNIGREIRELKLGATFSQQTPQTAFHTLKYDFKPASVDLSKVANLDVSSNNQVTVTVPNLESSGVPHTVFKGNQRKYQKECIIIFDRKTGVMTLEKLNHNIQVKKTRSEPMNKLIAAPPPKIAENNTQRTSSKTRVSTGVRKNNIIGFVPRSSPMQQGSPSYTIHKSPQSAPAWNANNGQSTLPSIPIIGLDDDIFMSTSACSQQANSSNQLPNLSSDFHQPEQANQQNNHHSSSVIITGGMGPVSTSTSSNNASAGSTSLALAAEQEIGILSSSDSSSDSDSSDSGSDSDESFDNASNQRKDIAASVSHQSNRHHHTHQQSTTYENGSLPTLLHDDLQLSESNSSESEDF